MKKFTLSAMEEERGKTLEFLWGSCATNFCFEESISMVFVYTNSRYVFVHKKVQNALVYTMLTKPDLQTITYSV